MRSDAKNCLKKRLMETVTAQKQKEQSSRNVFFFLTARYIAAILPRQAVCSQCLPIIELTKKEQLSLTKNKRTNTALSKSTSGILTADSMKSFNRITTIQCISVKTSFH